MWKNVDRRTLIAMGVMGFVIFAFGVYITGGKVGRAKETQIFEEDLTGPLARVGAREAELAPLPDAIPPLVEFRAEMRRPCTRIHGDDLRRGPTDRMRRMHEILQHHAPNPNLGIVPKMVGNNECVLYLNLEAPISDTRQHGTFETRDILFMNPTSVLEDATGTWRSRDTVSLIEHPGSMRPRDQPCERERPRWIRVEAAVIDMTGARPTGVYSFNFTEPAIAGLVHRLLYLKEGWLD